MDGVACSRTAGETFSVVEEDAVATKDCRDWTDDVPDIMTGNHLRALK